MNRGLATRAPSLAKTLHSILPCRRSSPLAQCRRGFASETEGGRGAAGKSSGSGSVSMLQLGSLLKPSQAGGAAANTRIDDSSLDRISNASVDELDSKKPANPNEPWHFHIYSHKHNTHITVTKPDRNPIISLSCGNLGFRKSGRKHYDSAYQLGAYVIDKLQQMGKHKDIDALEVSLRGFGPGRDAVTKVLLGNEGRLLRPKIVRVTDSTRLKFGGTRSKKPRRLG